MLLDCFNSTLAKMKNSVRANLAFSFKGETHSLTSVLDLDQLSQRYQHIPPLHRLLADEHQIDPYSYQFEMLEQEEITFDQATGAALPFLDEGVFDFQAYFQLTKTRTPDATLQIIAERELGAINLAQHPALQRALQQAYQLGISSCQKS